MKMQNECGSVAWVVGRFRVSSDCIFCLLPLRLACGRPNAPFPSHVQWPRRPKIRSCGPGASQRGRLRYGPHPRWRALLPHLNAESPDGRSRTGHIGEKRVIVSKLSALETRREAAVRLQPDIEGAGASPVRERYVQSKIDFPWRKPRPNSQET